MEFENNTAQVVADLMKGLHGAQVTTVTDGTTTAPVLLAPKQGGGFELQSLKSHLDQYRSNPERREGQARLTTIESFIAHVNRFKDDDSALFADRNPEQPALLGVLDYHHAVNTADGVVVEDALPRFGKHRAYFSFPMSDEWKAWNQNDGKKMEQVDFAEFIEDRIGDVITVPDLSNPQTDADKQLKQFADLLGGSFATPSKMVELSRGIAIHADEKVKQATNVSTGEIQVQYESEHRDQQGAPIKVPNLFLIAIPVFEAGGLYRVAVRLRYRLAGGRIAWFYELYRIDKVFKHAFDEACTKAAAETGLPIFSGFPEGTTTR